ncbi:PSP domain-containing protein [Ditylenchus destructor]|nr:PSP domain-containing protein [Ditylenchus destructor]
MLKKAAGVTQSFLGTKFFAYLAEETMRRKGKNAPVPVQVDLCDELEPTNGDVNGGSRSSSSLECTFQQNDMFMIDTEACEEHENEAFVKINTEPRLHEQLEGGTSFKPGVVSDSLREALGLGPRDIPEWIYRMRKKGFIEGYPPAYLKRAIQKNILNFVVSDADPSTATEGQDVVDPAKIIAYYGFNKEDKKLIDPEHFKVRHGTCSSPRIKRCCTTAAIFSSRHPRHRK